MDSESDRRTVLKQGAASAFLPAMMPAAALAQTPNAVPDTVQAVKVYDLREIEERAKAVLPKGPYDYIATGVGDGWTQQENLDALKRVTLTPRFMTGARSADQSITLLGSKLATPVIIPPMGNHGMVHASAEAGTARGAEAEGVLMTPSIFSTLSLEEIA
ncbi:MAG TPA: alpha-hydroxy-acid oxidizing protein, partial [Sphingobium sp.]|nr:alpha-hydroxy-acid oxidizing protein [Sphingobium sp.]